MKELAFLILIFQIIVNIKCQQQPYVPVPRQQHTATLVEKKIFFLGGLSDDLFLNDFFFLDLSKSIDATKQIPFIYLSINASTLPPPHFASAASFYGKDSIFLFGGYVNDSFSDNLAFSFNTTKLQWDIAAILQGDTPKREATMSAVTDNNNKIYVFSGSFDQFTINPKSRTEYIKSTKMNIYDTINKIWTVSESGLPGRDGHTCTFLPDTNDIIYIGGHEDGLGDLTSNLDVYNTQSNSWRKVPTKNPPEQRFGHTAVLTNDKRIIVFGGGQPTDPTTPVNNQYVVLDTKTFEWYHGIGDVSSKAPIRHHTATLYDDYMFIAFGVLPGQASTSSSGFLIYKIGDYANFSSESIYTPPIDPTPSSTSTSTTSSTPANSNNNHSEAAIRASIGSLLCIILGFIGFIAFKWYKKTRNPKFEHVLNT